MLVLLYMNFAIATVLAIFCILHQLGILIFSYNSFYKSFFGKNLIFKIDGLNNLIDKLNREKTFSTNKVKKYDSDLRFNLLKVNKSLKKLVITQKIDKSFYENKYERMNYSLLANLAEKYNNYYEFKKQLKNELLPYEKVNFIILI